MRQIFIRYPNKTARLLEISVPLVAYLLITMPVWLSFWHPAIVAYLVITFDVYWFAKSFSFAYHAVRSYISMLAYTKVDWRTKAVEITGFEKLFHIVIIPEYCEPLHILRRTLVNLTKQDFPLERIIVVLATEGKDPLARPTAATLRKEFGNQFGHFLTTLHPVNTQEMAGKSANMAWAAKRIVEHLSRWNISEKFTTITSCDADALIHPKYFSCLSYNYLTDPDREYHFYQGAILFYSNIWRIPLPGRVVNTISSIWNLSLLSQSGRLINFSTYSLPLSTAVSAGYWSTNVIPEDYHLFFKVYFKYGYKVQTRPLYLPILVDAAESKTFWKTLVNQYEQAKRWAWGVSDIPYVVRGIVLHNEIPLPDRLRRLFLILEQHVFWPTNWFLLTLGSALPPLINPAFARTTLGHNLSKLSSGILTLSAVFLLVIAFIDWQAKPPKPKEISSWKLPLFYLQWLTLPIISFFLSAIPGLDAHTRLMLGKKLEYRVTEKI